MSAPEGLALGKCPVCHARFVPADGTCPRCGSTTVESYLSAGTATVLAATALEVPLPGWKRPHLLALVEVDDGVRLLVVPHPPLPEVGATVRVRLEEGIYRATGIETGERGEGDAPGAG